MTGFQSPNYTQTPNDLFDELLPSLGLAELKVVLCVVRHTFGYHTEEVKLSIREIARFTGLTAKSVMEGAEQAEAHGLIERYQDGKKTTLWRAIVTVIPSNTRSDTRYHRGVLPTTTQVGVKESKEIKKETPKGDLVDLELSKLPAISIRKAISDYFKLNVNWDTKTSRQFMEWAVQEGITAAQIEQAADTWRMDKQFNWQVPTLKGIFEKWQMLMDAQVKATSPIKEYQPLDESEFVPSPVRK